MSFLPDQAKQVPFYLTRPAPCPYLQGQVEQKIFTRLSDEAAPDFLLASGLNQHGFRRSQTMLYRPACPACMACVPVRIALSRFTATQSLRRINRRNTDLGLAIKPVAECGEYFQLFSRYQQQRHGDSDMANMAELEFHSMMVEGGANALLLTLVDKNRHTLGVMLVDQLHHGTSAVYSYFEPAEDARSLGTELVLRLIEWTAGEKKDYVYLGYWIKNCQKMQYKVRFPALEQLGPNGWEPFVTKEA